MDPANNEQSQNFHCRVVKNLMYEVHFEWLGELATLRTDSRAFATNLRGILRDLLRAPGDGNRVFVVRFEAPEGPVLEWDGSVRALDRADPGTHAWSLVLGEILSRCRGYFVLHAAAVARCGRAVVISAPSGFGKSTLALLLACRGFGLLADDLAPVARETGLIFPMPRSITLREGTRALLPKEIVDRARERREGVDREGGWIVAPRSIFSTSLEPVPPGLVLVGRASAGDPRIRELPLVEVRALAGEERFLSEIAHEAGVTEVRRDPEEPLVVRARLARSRALDAFLARHRASISAVLRLPSELPRFDDSPRFTPIGPFQAAVELTQEMMNRGEGSSLEQEFRGCEGRMVAELAERLSLAPCYACTPGRLEETIEGIEQRFEPG